MGSKLSRRVLWVKIMIPLGNYPVWDDFFILDFVGNFCPAEADFLILN